MKDLLSSTDVKLDLYLVTFLGPIAGYCGAFGSLCAIADWFTIWWFIFGLFLVFPISTAIGFALFVLIPIDSSPEGKKAAAKIAVESIFQWLCYDFCYLAIFNHWLIPTFILGIISVVLMFIEIINTFLFNAKKSVILFICELLVGISLTVYLIYIIPESTGNLQNIVIPIIAALYGGLFTLLGVAWTIKKGDDDRKKDREQLEQDRQEEERKKFVPYIKFEGAIHPLNFVGFNQPDNCLLDDENKVYYSIYIKPFTVKNISNNNIILEKVMLLGKTYELENNRLLESNGCCQVQLNTLSNFICSELPDKVVLIVSDIVGHLYNVDCFIVHRLKLNIPNEVQTENGKKFSVWEYDCFVQTISLPLYIGKEKTNK